MCRSIAGIRSRAPPATRSQIAPYWDTAPPRACWADGRLPEEDRRCPRGRRSATPAGTRSSGSGTTRRGRPSPITPGTYCFRVRARTDRDDGNLEVYGDYTYLDERQHRLDGPGSPAFDWTATRIRPPARTRAGRLRLPVRGRLPRARDRDYERRARRSSPGSRSPARTATSSSSRRTRTSATSSTRASPGPGLRAPDLAQADDLHRRDDHLLLGDAAGDGRDGS